MVHGNSHNDTKFRLAKSDMAEEEGNTGGYEALHNSSHKLDVNNYFEGICALRQIKIWRINSK